MRRSNQRPEAGKPEVEEFDEAQEKPEGLVAPPLPVPSPEAAQHATQSRLMPEAQADISQYVVMNHSGRNVMLHGGLVLLRQGKVVDSVNYDIAYLQSQGVELQPFKPVS